MFRWRIGTLPAPDTGTVTVTITVPDDLTYIAFLNAWLSHLSLVETWRKYDTGNLTDIEQAAVFAAIWESQSIT